MRRLLALGVVSLLLALVPGTAFATPPGSAQQTSCHLPESDASARNPQQLLSGLLVGPHRLDDCCPGPTWHICGVSGSDR